MKINKNLKTNSVITASARYDRRTKRLSQRLRVNEIAVINHADLDGPATEGLIARKISCVINCAPSITGRYPNRGPELLLKENIVLIDNLPPEFTERVVEGELLTVDGNNIYRGDELIGSGILMTPERLEQELENARKNLNTALKSFVENTLSYVNDEQGLLYQSIDIPQLRTEIKDRPVVIVVRGENARIDLTAIRGYIRNIKPVIIGVDGGADLLLEQSIKPHIIFGDMDSISDNALKCGAEIVVHAYTDGRSPGAERLKKLNVPHQLLPARGTSEDIIMLVAYEKGADIITVIGTHTHLTDFLDKSRSGMSSTFLVRLRIGSKLLDVKGINRLYNIKYPKWHFAMMFVASLLALGTIILLSKDVQSFIQLFWLRITHLF